MMSRILEKEDLWFRAWFKKFENDLNESDPVLSNTGENELNGFVTDPSLLIETIQPLVFDSKPRHSDQKQDRMVCVTTGNQNIELPFLYVQNASALMSPRNRTIIIRMVLYLDDESIEKEIHWSNKIRKIMSRGCMLSHPDSMARFSECKLDKPITDKKIRSVKLDFSAKILWK